MGFTTSAAAARVGERRAGMEVGMACQARNLPLVMLRAFEARADLDSSTGLADEVGVKLLRDSHWMLVLSGQGRPPGRLQEGVEDRVRF
jgi:hypothetical protein